MSLPVRGLCALLVLLPCLLRAQDGPPSPVRVRAMPDDTAKVIALSDLCFGYRRIDADSALLFGREALDLSQRIRYRRGEAQALNDLAIIHIDRSSFTVADSLLQQALAIRRALHDSAGVGAIHNKLGNIRQAQFRLEEALQENMQALRIFERIGPQAKEAIILGNIAILQFNLRQYKEALATHRSAAALRERIGDGQGLAESKGNMANVLVVLGDTAEALRLFGEAAAYFRGRHLDRELAVQLHNEAGLRLSMGETATALALYTEALALREAGGEQKAIASTLTGLADTRVRMGSPQAAVPLAHRALALSAQVGARNERMQAMLVLARAHAALDNGDSTYWYHDRYSALRDSVFSADMGARLAELETRYNMERKELEIERQRADLASRDLAIAELDRQAERRRFWLALAIGAIGLVVVTGLLLMQVQRRKAKAARDADLLAERERGLRAVIAGTDAERARIARELHDGIGQQITGLKFRLEDIAGRVPQGDPSAADRIREALSLTDEAGRDVREIAHGMMPRSLGTLGLAPALGDLLGKAFDRAGITWTFDAHGVDQRMAEELEVGVYRIMQELVGNILKHAGAKEVNVQLFRNRGNLVLLVNDDGRGFGPDRDTGAGMGLAGMRDRARLLGGTFNLESAPGQGTTATLRIPLEPSTLPA